MRRFRKSIGAIAAIVAMGIGGTAQAQRLDSNDCNNALYHYEDATVSPAHLSTILRANSRTYCAEENGQRICRTGQEVYDGYVEDIRSLGITRIDITRMALFPELEGSSSAACFSNGDGTSTLALIVNRHFTKPGDDIFDEIVVSFRYRTLSNGSIDMISSMIYGPNTIAPAALQVNPWSRRQFLFDRNYGSRRTVFAQGADEYRGQGAPQSARSSGGGQGGGGSTSITRDGYGLSSSATGASSLAERNARNNAIGACRTRGGSPGRVTTRPTGSRQATSSSYSANYEATVQCGGL